MARIRKRRLEAGKPLLFPNLGKRKTLADFGEVEGSPVVSPAETVIPQNEEELKAEQQKILATEEERARLARIAAVRDRVELRNSFLLRTFGSRSGGRPPILGFRR